MPSADQRLQFWKSIWKVIEEKKIFLIDFLNHGTMVKGCIAAGRDGGYLHIDWDGNIMPCVFLPYIAGNIRHYYHKEKNLNDVLDQPFLKAIRDWQKKMGHGSQNLRKDGNLLTPCPYRDHHIDFTDLLNTYNPAYQFNGLDGAVGPKNVYGDHKVPKADFINGRVYRDAFLAYGKQMARHFDPIWKKRYMGSDQ